MSVRCVCSLVKECCHSYRPSLLSLGSTGEWSGDGSPLPSLKTSVGNLRSDRRDAGSSGGGGTDEHIAFWASWSWSWCGSWGNDLDWLDFLENRSGSSGAHSAGSQFLGSAGSGGLTGIGSLPGGDQFDDGGCARSVNGIGSFVGFSANFVGGHLSTATRPQIKVGPKQQIVDLPETILIGGIIDSSVLAIGALDDVEASDATIGVTGLLSGRRGAILIWRSERNC